MRAGVKYFELSSVCTSITDGSHFSPKEDPEGLIPMLSVKDMTADGFDYSSCKYICESDYQVLVANGCRPSVGDVLVAKDGSYLKTAFVQKENKEQALLSSIAILTPKTEIILPEYLAFFFKAPHTKATVEKHYLTGTAIKRVILKGFKVIKAPVPPLSEQERIVAELDLLQGIIDKQKAQLKELDTLAQSIFYDMFGDPVENEKGWEVKKLGDVCLIERGGSPRPIDDYLTEDERGINWIKIGDATDGGMVITATKQRIRPEGMKKSRFVHKGDFLLSNSMSFGKPYILGVDGCIHDGWLVIQDTHHTFNKIYLYYFLGSPQTYEAFNSMAVGGVVNNLNKDIVKKVHVAIPDADIQQSFATKIEAIESQKTLINQSIAETQKLFDFTMDKYFG